MAENKTPVASAYIRKSPDFPDASTKGVTTLIKLYDTDQGKTTAKGNEYGFVHAEMARFEGANSNQNPQVNPAYYSKQALNEDGSPRKGANGKDLYNTGQPYSKAEIDNLLAAAGPNVQTLYKHAPDADGNMVKTDEVIGKAAVVDINLMFDKDRGGLRMNHKTAKAYEGPVPEDAISAQFDAVRAESTKVLSDIAAKKEAKASAAIESQANPAPAAPEAANDQPEF